MRRFEQNHPSLFDVLEENRLRQAPTPRPETRRPETRRPANPRPAMLRPARAARRGAAWWAAAAFTLAGASGLSLLWHTQSEETVTALETPTLETPILESPASPLLQVAVTSRWSPSKAPTAPLVTPPPPAPARVRPSTRAAAVPPPPPVTRPPVAGPDPAPVITAATEPAPPEPTHDTEPTEPAIAEAADVAEAPATELAVATPEIATAPPVVVDLLPPVKLYTPPPKYPLSDWLSAVEGDVTLKARVDANGRVATVEVLEAPSPGLEKAAVRALEQWRFRPATRDGEPVAAHHVQTFRFSR